MCGYIYCTNVFVKRGTTHRFCSVPCRLPSCAKWFRPYHMQVYCSYRCSMRHHYELHRAERIAYQKRYDEAHRDRINEQARRRRRRAA